MDGTDSFIVFGIVFSVVVVVGGELQSTVTIVGILLIIFVDVDECRGGLCAACRVLFGKTVRKELLSELTGSI